MAATGMAARGAVPECGDHCPVGTLADPASAVHDGVDPVAFGLGDLLATADADANANVLWL